jgi:AcrR family transcriptional regulator
MVDPDPDAPSLTVKGVATRDRIVSCATELVLAQGLSALSILNVRKAASVSGSQMTHYFPDKDSLVRAVISRQTQAVLDFHRQPALRDLDTFEDFDHWAQLTLGFGRHNTRARPIPTYGALDGGLSKYDEKTRGLLADGYRQWAQLLATGLQRMKDRGVLLAQTDPAELAAVLISAHQGGNMLTLAYRRPWPDRDALMFALGYLRLFAVDPADRFNTAPAKTARRARHSRGTS